MTRLVIDWTIIVVVILLMTLMIAIGIAVIQELDEVNNHLRHGEMPLPDPQMPDMTLSDLLNLHPGWMPLTEELEDKWPALVQYARYGTTLVYKRTIESTAPPITLSKGTGSYRLMDETMTTIEKGYRADARGATW